MNDDKKDLPKSNSKSTLSRDILTFNDINRHETIGTVGYENTTNKNGMVNMSNKEHSKFVEEFFNSRISNSGQVDHHHHHHDNQSYPNNQVKIKTNIGLDKIKPRNSFKQLEK